MYNCYSCVERKSEIANLLNRQTSNAFSNQKIPTSDQYKISKHWSSTRPTQHIESRPTALTNALCTDSSLYISHPTPPNKKTTRVPLQRNNTQTEWMVDGGGLQYVTGPRIYYWIRNSPISAHFRLFSAYFPAKMVPHPCYKLKHGTQLRFFRPHVYGFCLFSTYIPLIFRLFSA